MKIYPWKGLKWPKEGKYGIFPDMLHLDFGWNVDNVYETPGLLGENVGEFLSRGVHGSGIQLERVFPRSGSEIHLDQYVENGRIKGLTRNEFLQFRDAVKRKYPDANSSDI